MAKCLRNEILYILCFGLKKQNASRFFLSYLTEALLFSVFVFNLKKNEFYFSIESFFFLDRDTTLNSLFNFVQKEPNEFCWEVMIYFGVFATSQLEYFKNILPRLKRWRVEKKTLETFLSYFEFFLFVFLLINSKIKSRATSNESTWLDISSLLFVIISFCF